VVIFGGWFLIIYIEAQRCTEFRQQESCVKMTQENTTNKSAADTGA
jgi:hypothetical protein